MQKEPPSTSIQESVLVIQEDAMKIMAPSTLVPQILVHPHGQEVNAESIHPLSVQANEQEGNAASIPQLPVHPEVSTIKTSNKHSMNGFLLHLWVKKDGNVKIQKRN
ncbi:hypothetical protein ACFX1S_034699 [Malus domestica]